MRIFGSFSNWIHLLRVTLEICCLTLGAQMDFVTEAMLCKVFRPGVTASRCDELRHVSALPLKLRSSPALADTLRDKRREPKAIQVILILCFSISISIPTRKLLHQYTGTVEGLCRVLLEATSQTIFILPNSPGFL